MVNILQATPENLRRACESLRAGNLVSFPTETVYGLGAVATCDAAVAKIFAAKGRPSTNPLIVHVDSVDGALRLCANSLSEPQRTRFLRLSSLWPGPLSVVVPKAPQICSLVTAGGITMAVRVPNQPIALQMLQQIGQPIAAPSANRSLRVSPTTAQHVADEFPESDLIVLDGGPCRVGLESTVVDITGESVVVLRAGSISLEDVSALLPHETVCDQSERVARTDEASASPGQLGKHYSPNTPVEILKADTEFAGRRVGLIAFSASVAQQLTPQCAHIEVLSTQQDFIEIAAKLYAALRSLDQHHLDCIVIDTCPEVGIGRAIMDRIKRAAAREP